MNETTSSATQERNRMRDAATGDRSQRRALVLMSVATFAFWVSLYLYGPILPLRAKELGASPAIIGAVVAAYAIGQVTLRIPVGIGSDVFGRKPFAVAAIFLCAAGAAWLGAADTPWMLFAARTLTGIGAAGWVAISVLYASHFPPDRPGRAMAAAMAINTTGILVATLIGGELAERLGSSSAFYGAAGVGVAGVLVMFAVKEPVSASRTPYSFNTLVRLLHSPLLLQVSTIAITLQFVTFGVNFGFLPIYAEGLGATKAQIGYITAAGLVAAIIGTLLSQVVARRYGSAVAVLIGIGATIGSLVALPFTDGLVVLAVGQAVNGFGRGMLNTVLISLALQSAPSHERATAMGTYQAIYAIGMLSGPLICGVIAGQAGIEWVFWTSAAVITAGGALVFMRKLPQV